MNIVITLHPSLLLPHKPVSCNVYPLLTHLPKADFMASKKEKLYLIDGSSYIFRAFYGIKQFLSNSKGLPTNALYGFTNMLIKVVREEAPDYLAVVFDSKEPTFRHKMYPEYKANRDVPPEELAEQTCARSEKIGEGLFHRFAESLMVRLRVEAKQFCIPMPVSSY